MPTDAALRSNNQVMNNDRGNYWRYYGLQRDPFAPGILDGEVYAVARWEEYTDLLHYLCGSSNTLLLITGIKGIGKTTFMHQFMSQLDEATLVCQLHGTSALEIDQINLAMLKNFAIHAPQGESLDDRIESLVMNIQQSVHPCLLIIDDAHRLKESVLQTLLQLIKQQSEAQMRLHIILLGLPQLSETYAHLSATEGAQELIHSLNLEPLTLEETHTYIKHRLAVAGLPAAIPLSPATIKRIYNLSDGVIDRINVVARQAMIDGMRQPQLQIAFDLIRSYKTQFIGGSIFLIVLIMVAVFLARGSRLSHFPLHFSLPKFYQPTVPSKNVAAVTPAIGLTASPASQSVTEANPVKNTVMPPITESDYSNKTATVTTAENQMSKETSAFMQPALDFTPPAHTVTDNAASESAMQVNSASTTSETKPISNTEKATTAKSPITFTVKDKKLPAKKTTKKSIAANELLNANPEHFTLQIIGLSSEPAMQKFIAANHLQGSATYFHTKRAGKDWYVLISGDYKSIPQAKAAIEKLPLALQQQKPWVRKLSSVQHVS